jgi:hypothetical protein
MKVRTHQAGGRNIVHDIEITDWWVNGYVNGRCLTHGLEGPAIAISDPTAQAISVARACCLRRTIPGHQDRELAPLAPAGGPQ